MPAPHAPHAPHAHDFVAGCPHCDPTDFDPREAAETEATLDRLGPEQVALLAYLGVHCALARLGPDSLAAHDPLADPVRWAAGLARFGRWPVVHTAWRLGTLATRYHRTQGLPEPRAEAALAVLERASRAPRHAALEAALAEQLARVEAPWRAAEAELAEVAHQVLSASDREQPRATLWVARHCQLGAAFWALRAALARSDHVAGRHLARAVHVVSCLPGFDQDLPAIEELVSRDLLLGTLYPELLGPASGPAPEAGPR